MKRAPDRPMTAPPIRGRPRNAEPSSPVTTWLPNSAHDKLIRLAQEQETTISALVRSLLILRLR